MKKYLNSLYVKTLLLALLGIKFSFTKKSYKQKCWYFDETTENIYLLWNFILITSSWVLKTKGFKNEAVSLFLKKKFNT